MAGPKRILVVDDEEGLCRMVDAILTDGGYAVTTQTRSFEAVESFEAGRFDLVITDVRMPGMDGLEVLQRVKAAAPAVPVIVITAHATVEMSVQALRKGAYDMVTKPFEPEELIYRVRNALRQSELLEENRGLLEELAEKSRFGSIIGDSPRLLSVLETARKVAARDIPVLITGESGTGKELVAQAIHAQSPRRKRKFVAINCGALPQSLLESELFGTRKGAFTGADRDRKGLLETADGGTLFLDEVGTLPRDVQKTLLRFLQEQEFYRVGDTKATRVSVRVLSATNADLEAGVQDGSFREDLFYRLNVVNVHLPPLRERPADIPLLVAHFVREQNERFGTAVRGFTPEAMEAACRYPWPGNVRHLRNVVEASLAVSSGEYVDLPTLAQFIEVETSHPEGKPASDGDDYASALARFEVSYLQELLGRTAGNVDEAARLADINVATIYRKIKKYGLRKEEFV
ncbi:MAG: sigma-54-dependent Fis family transcriptional regulator [Proteobacteria bacterium]|nr:sigma-54-dependent Fis family transcriptional regulator [Pseudomonadota bacterium]